MTRRLLFTIALALGVSADVEWADSPTLTSMWQAISSGGPVDRLLEILVTNRESAHHRSADGRGPLYWAFEFQNAEALAICKKLEVAMDMEDSDGKTPDSFFPGTQKEKDAFVEKADAQVATLGAQLEEKEQEFLNWQKEQAEADSDDDYYDDEASEAPEAGDDEEEDEEEGEEPEEEEAGSEDTKAADRKARLEVLKAKAKAKKNKDEV